jgi:hypothetical protein
MNHKRKRPRNARAGCKLCKPWKVNGFCNERPGGEPHSDHKRRTEWSNSKQQGSF